MPDGMSRQPREIQAVRALMPLPYSLQWGIPRPTPNFCEDGVILERPWVTQLQLSDFPKNIIPSGGISCTLSRSEMFAVIVQWQPAVKIDTTTHIYFYRCDTKEQIAHLEGKDFAEDSDGALYAGFIGHYDWELAEPGKYHARVVTRYGTDVILFEVI